MKRKQNDPVEGDAKRSRPSEDAEPGSQLYRAPTGEEMTAIRETEGSFRSNLFRLQTSELLSEVNTKPRYSALDKALAVVKQHLEGLPAVEPFKLADEAAWLPAGVVFPLPKELLGNCTKDATFSFSAPSSINVIGSYLLGTLTKPSLNIDLAVQIPADSLDDGDHLNHRYVHKRAAYLCYLAHHLTRCSAVSRVEFICLHSRLMPVLAVTLTGKPGQRFSLRVHPVVNDAAFKPTRLGPARNCIRRKKFFKSVSADSEGAEEPATPYYNSLLLRDMAPVRHLAMLHTAFQQCPAMPDAMRLLKVWLRQRSLDKGLRSFNGFLGSMLAAHLLKTNQISRTMSSYQILRMILRTLAQSDWTQKGLFMFEGENTPSPADFHGTFEVVFVDDSGHLNLTSHMTEASYHELTHEAKLALACLDARSSDAFDSLFMQAVKPSHKFDQVIQLTNVSPLKRSDTAAWQDRCLAAGGEWLCAGERYAGRVLRRGLGERATLVSVHCDSKLQWSIGKAPVKLQSSTITVALLLDHAPAFAIVQHGPAADATEAADFRAFWGKKSELRRFQDSSILEAVVWSSNSVAEKRTIPSRIVSHLMERHMSLPASSIIDCTRPYDALLQPAPLVKTSTSHLPDGSSGLTQGDNGDEEIIPKNSQQAKALLALEKAAAEKNRKKPKTAFVGTGEEETSKIVSAFEYLARHLRAMEDLSLDIISVQGASPLFRHTDVFPTPIGMRCKGAKSLSVAPPQGKKVANWRSGVLLPGVLRSPPLADVFDVVCHLEGCGSWPDDVDAIARVKATFFLQLAAILEQKHSITSVPTPTHLYICVNGYVFRMAIAHAFELTLLERSDASSAESTTGAAGTVAAVTTQSVGMATPASAALTVSPRLTELQRHTVAMPLHTGHVHSLSQQYPAYSMTCRLAKRWLSSQLMARFFSDEIVELLVAYLFINPGPFQPPGSGISGLLRFFTLLVTFDWAGQPLIVNIASELNSEGIGQLTSMFQSRRQHLPAMVIFTPSDTNSSWTAHKPPLLALRRCQLLAQQAMSGLEDQVMSTTASCDRRVMFRPSLDDFHVLIHLRSRHIPHLYQSLARSQQQAVEVEADDLLSGPLQLPVAGFDPVKLYLDQLEASYGHVALFFYDRYGGVTIGVVWLPQSAETPQFKISTASGFCPVPAPKKGKKSKSASNDAVPTTVCFNKAAALDDFRILGTGLVRQVEEQEEA
ncbi:nucleolar protein 6-like isoform X1 [Sycon ciliatum]|uniref:nucleolar protein 6-like isoform X1 n=1 Tax=Sycon ciliatum TaxID=27933 RepID=UPI0031F61F5F